MRELIPLDFTILNFLSETPRPVRELVAAQPRGSVYRRLKRLQADGWVIKGRQGYALTAAGQQVKAEREAAACLGGLGIVREFNWSSQLSLCEPIVGPRRAPRPVFASRGSFAA
jgi:DNA-binding PadR family transcriptional regulator